MEKTILVSLLGIVLSAVLMPTLSFASHSSPFSSVASFQSKAAILDNMPSHNVTVGDINIAYKQIGRPDGKPIILITGASATMDMWNPLLLEELTSANYKVIIKAYVKSLFEQINVEPKLSSTENSVTIEVSANQFGSGSMW